MADLNIAEHRMPQTGQVNINAGSKSYLMRVHIMPTEYGELCQLELHAEKPAELGEFGADNALIEKFSNLIRTKSSGVIIVAAPQDFLLKNIFQAVFGMSVFSEKHLICLEDKVTGWKSPYGIHTRTNHKASYTLENALETVAEMDFDCIAIHGLNSNVVKQIYAMFGRLIFISIVAVDVKAIEKQMVNIYGVTPQQYRSQTIAVLFANGDKVTLT